MFKKLLFLSIIILFATWKTIVSADVIKEKIEPQILDGVWDNVGESFGSRKFYFHLLGAVATPVLIRSGVDAQVYSHFRQTTNDATWPGAVIGSGAIALGAGLWLYLLGKSEGDNETLRASYVIAQATLITVTYVMFLKALTGRAHPANWSSLSPQEQSEDFIFGFKKPLTGYGWPSGHVSHTVAVTSALATYYSDKTWLKWLSLGLSSYMLYTISAFNSAQMHWFSDGVAGAFMGYAIGTSVGAGLRQHQNDESKTFAWWPVLGSESLSVVGVWSLP